MKNIIILITATVALAILATAQPNQSTQNALTPSSQSSSSQSDQKTVSNIEKRIIETIKMHAGRIQNLESHATKLAGMPKQLSVFQKQQSNLDIIIRNNTKAINTQRQLDDHTQANLDKLEKSYREIGRNLDAIQWDVIKLFKEAQTFQSAQAYLHHSDKKMDYTLELNHSTNESQSNDIFLALIDDAYWITIVIGLSTSGLSIVLFSFPHWPTWNIHFQHLIDQYRQDQKAALSANSTFQDKQNGPVNQTELDFKITEKPQKVSNSKPSGLKDIQIQEPPILLEDLVGQTDGISEDAFLNAPWKTGSACIKGEVRDENQDYALAFSFGSFQVGLVADGMGGLDHGKQASYLAIRAAAKSILIDLNGTPKEESLLNTCHAAIDAASNELARISQTYDISPNSGLRTTFIVCIGSQNLWTLYYSGDGGAVLLKKDGTVDDILKPQRDDPNQPNLLSGSLGPDLAGIPVPIVQKRETGDLMILGSDGVFERVAHQFPHDVLKCAFQYKGNLEETAKALIKSMSIAKDRHGYICDDNLSLVCMSDGKSPQLKPSFRASLFNLKASLTSK